MQGLISAALLLLCFFCRAQAQVPCELNFGTFEDFQEIDIQRLVGRWYRSSWGAYRSTQQGRAPWSDHMLIVAKSEDGANTTSFHIGIRADVLHDRCIAGVGSISHENTTKKTARLAFDIHNTSISLSVKIRMMDVTYDDVSLVVFCGKNDDGDVCQGEDLEFLLWSRTTQPDKNTIKRLQEKMKLHCIRDSWINENHLAPCDARNQAGQANCPVNVNLMKYVEDVDFTKLAGKWYQITYASNYTTYGTVWPDYLVELTSRGSFVSVAAQIRQTSSDKECLMVQGNMTIVDGYDSLYRSTLVNEQANVHLTWQSRILEVDYDAYKVVGICRELEEGHCQTTEVSVWSRQKFLSSEHLKNISHWYSYMCLKTEWIAVSEQKPCDELEHSEPTQAATSRFPHISLLVAMIILSYIAARSADSD